MAFGSKYILVLAFLLYHWTYSLAHVGKVKWQKELELQWINFPCGTIYLKHIPQIVWHSDIHTLLQRLDCQLTMASWTQVQRFTWLTHRVNRVVSILWVIWLVSRVQLTHIQSYYAWTQLHGSLDSDWDMSVASPWLQGTIVRFTNIQMCRKCTGP